MSSCVSCGVNRLFVNPGLMQASAAAEKELSASCIFLYRLHITLDYLVLHIRSRLALKRP